MLPYIEPFELQATLRYAAVSNCQGRTGCSTKAQGASSCRKYRTSRGPLAVGTWHMALLIRQNARNSTVDRPTATKWAVWPIPAPASPCVSSGRWAHELGSRGLQDVGKHHPGTLTLLPRPVSLRPGARSSLARPPAPAATLLANSSALLCPTYSALLTLSAWLRLHAPAPLWHTDVAAPKHGPIMPTAACDSPPGLLQHC